MSSPLSSFANARILWLAPGSRSSGREGYKLSPGQPHLIEAFIKRRTTPSQLADRYGLPAVNGQPMQFSGYVIRFAQITPEQAEQFDTLELSSLEWDDSMLLPSGVRRDAKAKLFIQGLEKVEVRFTDKASTYGEEGIGAILRGVLGDQVFLEGGQLG